MAIKHSFLVILLFFFTAVRAEECTRIAVPAGTGGTGEMAEIAHHVFDKAGLCILLIRYPPKRIDAAIEDREVDGWVQAVGDEAQPSKFILIGHDLGQLDADLYWPADKEEPKGREATIGAVIGQVWAERESQRRDVKLYEVTDNKQLMKMASMRRIQGLLMPDIAYRHFLVEFPELRSYSRIKVAQLRIRIALLASFKSLANRLDAAVVETKAEGYPDRIWRAYLRQAPDSVPWQQMDRVIKP